MQVAHARRPRKAASGGIPCVKHGLCRHGLHHTQACRSISAEQCQGAANCSPSHSAALQHAYLEETPMSREAGCGRVPVARKMHLALRQQNWERTPEALHALSGRCPRAPEAGIQPLRCMPTEGKKIRAGPASAEKGPARRSHEPQGWRTCVGSPTRSARARRPAALAAPRPARRRCRRAAARSCTARWTCEWWRPARGAPLSRRGPRRAAWATPAGLQRGGRRAGCAGRRTVVMPTGGASAAMLNSKRRMSTASATTDSNSANWSPAQQPHKPQGGAGDNRLPAARRRSRPARSRPERRRASVTRRHRRRPPGARRRARCGARRCTCACRRRRAGRRSSR